MDYFKNLVALIRLQVCSRECMNVHTYYLLKSLFSVHNAAFSQDFVNVKYTRWVTFHFAPTFVSKVLKSQTCGANLIKWVICDR